MREHGHDVEWLDAEQLRAMVDSPRYLGAVRDPHGVAVVDPARLAWGLKQRCLELGVRAHERTRATSSRRSAGRAGRASATRATRWNLPRAPAHLGEPEAAVQLAAFAARFWTDRFGVLGARDQRDLRRVRRLACVQIGRPAVAAAWQAGEAMRVADALALARRHPQA